MKPVIRNALGNVFSVILVGFGLWMWYQIFIFGGRTYWTYWAYLKNNLEHLLLLAVSGLAVFAISERVTHEERLGWSSVWGWALLFAVLAGLFALLHLAGNTPPDSYPIYP